MNIVDLLISELGNDKVLTGEEVSSRTFHIWMPEAQVKAKAIVLPKSTEDIATVCRICYAQDTPIVIHGGLTNLVGSTESFGDEVVISMERMNRIIDIDPLSRTMTVEAGTVLQHIQEAASAQDLLFPMNFGAKGSCQIGGCIANNAGGLRVFKYGMTRQLILGLEVVLANGTVLSSLKKVMKDNAGYDLKQLFIGTEGTLGIVTKAVLRLYEQPKSRSSAFVGFDAFDRVLEFLKFADQRMGGRLSAYEVLWQDAYVALTSPNTNYQPPIPQDSKYYVLLEALGGHGQQDQEEFQSMVEDAWEDGIIQDAALALTDSDQAWFWNIREDVGNLLSQFDYRQDSDVSLPQNKMEEYVDKLYHSFESMPDVNRAVTFGHIADGNLHILVDKKNDSPQLSKEINEVIFGPISEYNGSISAEHGIGLLRKDYLGHSRTSAEIAVMKSLKKTLDPKNILNRGKVIDDD